MWTQKLRSAGWVFSPARKTLRPLSEHRGSTLGSAPESSFLLIRTTGGSSDGPSAWVPATYERDLD